MFFNLFPQMNANKRKFKTEIIKITNSKKIPRVAWESKNSFLFAFIRVHLRIKK